MNIPNACFFDLDGVLLDTEAIHSKAWQESANCYGTQLSNEQLDNLKGKRRVDCAKEIIKYIGKKISTEDFLITHRSIIPNLINNPNTVPGAEYLVKLFKQYKIPIALVTSSSKSSYMIKSQNHEWLDIFDIKVLGDDNDLKAGKPFPDPYLKAANKLSVNPKNSWAIEDSISGMQSAFDAGCKVWLLQEKTEHSFKSNNKSLYSNNRIIPITSLSQVGEKLKLLIQST